jgi:hypothetical protein
MIMRQSTHLSTITEEGQSGIAVPTRWKEDHQDIVPATKDGAKCPIRDTEDGFLELVPIEDIRVIDA